MALEVAEFASAAVVSLAALQLDFPNELSAPLLIGMRLLNGAVALVSVPSVRVVRRVEAKPKIAAPILRVVKPPPKVESKEESTEERSAWEPSSPYEGSRCKALLLEVLRRAAHDWVLYRGHSEITKRECAQDAFTWLFKEDEDHTSWKQRRTAVFDLDDGEIRGVRNITSFLSICEVLDLDPETVRDRVRQMTVQTIISAGRPAETRKTKKHNDVVSLGSASLAANINIDVLPQDSQYETQYESYGSIATPDTLSFSDLSGMH